MSNLASIAETIRRKNVERQLRIAVIGDVMRDEYLSGRVSRLCPEGDCVPVLSTGGDICTVPGGAGNTARQLRHWNANVFLLGLFDAETAELCHSYGPDLRHGVMLGSGRNPIKRRFYAGGQLLLRQDVEAEDYGDPKIDKLRQRLLEQLGAAMKAGIDALVISDYDRGCLDEAAMAGVLALCDEHDTLVVADPKRKSPGSFGDQVILKANETYHREHFGRRADVVTRAAAPPLCLNENGAVIECAARPPAHAVSVVGAGDCFAAHLALALAHGLILQDAVEFAYSAGRAYVQHLHNRPVMPHEVYADLDPAGAKIVTAVELREILDVRYPHARAVIAPGCYDPAHADHARMLAWAKQQGDVLIAALNSDASVRRLKGDGRPQLPAADRLRMIAGLECVDFVVEFDDDYKLLSLLHPAVLVKGSDYQGRPVAAADLADEVRIAPAGAGIHSSVLVV